MIPEHRLKILWYFDHITSKNRLLKTCKVFFGTPGKYSGGKIDFVTEGLITEKLIDYETICLEITISKKIWRITFAYRPPNYNNKDFFYIEVCDSIN